MNADLLYQARQAWRSSVLARVVAIGAVAVLLALCAAALAKGWEHFRGRLFDRREAEQERKVQALDQQIEGLKFRAERAEAKAIVAEQRAETLEALSRQQGAKAIAEAKKVDEAFAAFQKDNEITGAGVSDEIRYRRICEKRKELGYPCLR
jgi:hypothetical protein